MTQSLPSSEHLQTLIKKGDLNGFLNHITALKNSNKALDKTIFGECLFHAIEFQEFKIFKELLSLGFDVNEHHTFSFIPLHHAVDTETDTAHQLGRNPEPIFSKALLAIGADPKLKNKEGVTATEIATAYRYQAFLDLIT